MLSILFIVTRVKLEWSHAWTAICLLLVTLHFKKCNMVFIVLCFVFMIIHSVFLQFLFSVFFLSLVTRVQLEWSHAWTAMLLIAWCSWVRVTAECVVEFTLLVKYCYTLGRCGDFLISCWIVAIDRYKLKLAESAPFYLSQQLSIRKSQVYALVKLFNSLVL